MSFFKHATPFSTLLSRQAAAHAATARTMDRRSRGMWMLGTGLALGTALLGSAAAAKAQPVNAAPAPAAAAAEPRYSVAQIAQAFSFIDGNKDGKLSREEAAGFRGVARHFDEADTNKDGALSREEFENALSGIKSR